MFAERLFWDVGWNYLELIDQGAQYHVYLELFRGAGLKYLDVLDQSTQYNVYLECVSGRCFKIT